MTNTAKHELTWGPGFRVSGDEASIDAVLGMVTAAPQPPVTHSSPPRDLLMPKYEYQKPDLRGGGSAINHQPPATPISRETPDEVVSQEEGRDPAPMEPERNHARGYGASPLRHRADLGSGLEPSEQDVAHDTARTTDGRDLGRDHSLGGGGAAAGAVSIAQPPATPGESEDPRKAAFLAGVKWEREMRPEPAPDVVEALRQAADDFHVIQTLNSHGASDQTYIRWLRANAREAEARARAALARSDAKGGE